MRVKRERWKNKFVIVARDKGKIVAWTKYSRKEPIAKVRDHFFRFNSLNLNERVEKLRNVREVVVTPSTRQVTQGQVKRIRAGRYQLALTVRIRNTLITVRSDTHTRSFPVKKARQEAEERLYGRLSREVFNQGYDVELGREIARERNLQVRETIVYYK